MEDIKEYDLPKNFSNIVMKEFSKYDKNKNGFIEGDELIPLINNIADFYKFKLEEIEDKFANSVLGTIDLNNDKKISYQEFKEYFIHFYLSKN